MTAQRRDPRLRASDADRDAVAELLREHAATGRLTMDEFGERLDRCYAALTYGDLDALVEDLPGPDPYADLPVPPGRTRAPAGAAVGWQPHDPPPHHDGGRGAWATWASVSVICWAIWLATVVSGGGLSGLWPVWVTIPWGGVLLAGELTSGPERRALPRGRRQDRSRRRDQRRLGR